MNTDLKKLYSQIIKAHNETPFHFEKKSNPDNVISAYNPICGDRFDLYVSHNQNRINQLHFHGYGCAISKASTSVLVKTLTDNTLEEALNSCDNFLRYINREIKETELILSDDFKAFSGVHDFPERYDCATLSWSEMKKYLLTKKSKK